MQYFLATSQVHFYNFRCVSEITYCIYCAWPSASNSTEVPTQFLSNNVW